MLSEFQIPGTPVVPGREYEGREYKEAKNYLAGIQRFNNRCNNVLDLAIAQGNEKLARAVVALVKKNYSFLDNSNKGKIYIWYMEDDDITKAKEKLEMAIEEGAFNKE